MSQNKLIEIKELRKDYSTHSNTVVALDKLCLSIKQGEYISIMGPSGCGKSTLLNIIGILDEYDSGEYFLNGKSTKNLTDSEQALLRSTTLGFIFQSFNLLSHRTAIENVALPLYYQNFSNRIRLEKAMFFLDKLGLSDRAKHLPDELSGGQKQRVAIARALITDPKIILADEPTGALDSKTSEEIMLVLEDINSEGKTIILVTHDNNIAAQTNRIINLVDGRIVNDKTLIQSQPFYESAFSEIL